MSQHIKFTVDGKDYTLEFDTKSAQTVGRDIAKAEGEPIAMLEAIVYGAFIKHHSNLSKSARWKLYEDLQNKEEFFEILNKFYEDVVGAKLDDKDAKTSWEISE